MNGREIKSGRSRGRDVDVSVSGARLNMEEESRRELWKKNWRGRQTWRATAERAGARLLRVTGKISTGRRRQEVRPRLLVVPPTVVIILVVLLVDSRVVAALLFLELVYSGAEDTEAGALFVVGDLEHGAELVEEAVDVGAPLLLALALLGLASLEALLAARLALLRRELFPFGLLLGLAVCVLLRGAEELVLDVFEGPAQAAKGQVGVAVRVAGGGPGERAHEEVLDLFDGPARAGLGLAIVLGCHDAAASGARRSGVARAAGATSRCRREGKQGLASRLAGRLMGAEQLRSGPGAAVAGRGPPVGALAGAAAHAGTPAGGPGWWPSARWPAGRLAALLAG
mmetsp:Transcript_11066/g.35253  ORF Transcript_11066/g.35253 Transcript_11066/m.35253 type:complete len:342 (-) Transcript_11066:9-1034(-)